MLVCIEIDIAADAAHATCPSTGRLAIVIKTGPAASPPRRSRRRSPDFGVCRSSKSLQVVLRVTSAKL